MNNCTNLCEEEKLVEGIRSLVRLVTRTVLAELPTVENKRTEQVPPPLPPEPKGSIQAHGRRGLVPAESLAEFLGVPRSAIWRLARNGTIPSVRIGRNLRFDQDAVLEKLGAAIEQ